MGGKHEHLGYLDMGWSLGSIEGYVTDVIPRKRLDAFVHFFSTLLITVETNVREVRLHESGLDIRHADGCVCHVDAQAVFTAALVAQ